MAHWCASILLAVSMQVSAGLGEGLVLAQLVTQALPMPSKPLSGQLVGPCPEGIDEINGACWVKYALTPAQVKAGVCERDGLYEPSDGWCRTHWAGYRPFHDTRKSRNSVDDQ